MNGRNLSLDTQILRLRLRMTEPTSRANPSEVGQRVWKMRYNFNVVLTAAKASSAHWRSAREWAAEICVRMRALPCGTTG